MTTNTIRRLLEQFFKSASELDAFILDFFPSTKKLLTDAMDRTHKTNILLERHAKSDIVKALHSYRSEEHEDKIGEILKEALLIEAETAIESTFLLKKRTQLEVALFIVGVAFSTAFSRSPITSATVLSALFLMCISVFRSDFSVRLRISLVGVSMIFALCSVKLIKIAADQAATNAMHGLERSSDVTPRGFE